MLRLNCSAVIVSTIILAASVIAATTDLKAITEKNINQLEVENVNVPTALPFFVNEQTLRFARQNPSIIIIKHVSKASNKRKKPRRRLKRPKLKYNIPEYNFEQPISYYKPSHDYKLNEEYNGVNCEETAYKLPHCSKYDIKNAEYDFSHSKITNFDYETADNSQDYIPYELTTPACKQTTQYEKPRKPHRAYGVPVETEPDYYVPTTTIPDASYAIYDKPTNNDGYDFIEPNVNISEIDIDITYLPAYEINIPDSSDSGHFAEPPTSDNYEKNEQHTYTYVASKPELPLHTQEATEGFDYPKTSYEVPIYDPVSFHMPNENLKHEDFPPLVQRTTKKSTINTKHILDVPELEQAFEAAKQHQQVLTNALHLRPLRQIYANALHNKYKTQHQTAQIVLNKEPFKLAATEISTTTNSTN